MRTSAWPGPGSSVSTSTSDIFSGPPGSFTWMHFTAPAYLFCPRAVQVRCVQCDPLQVSSVMRLPTRMLSRLLDRITDETGRAERAKRYWANRARALPDIKRRSLDRFARSFNVEDRGPCHSGCTHRHVDRGDRLQRRVRCP